MKQNKCTMEKINMLKALLKKIIKFIDPLNHKGDITKELAEVKKKN